MCHLLYCPCIYISEQRNDGMVMVFSSLQFIFIFMPIFFGCYYIAPDKLKNSILFIGSLCFYFVGTIHNPEHFIVFILSIIADFVVGVWMSIGWYTIIYLSAMTSFDEEIYEAARVDGCSRFRMMRSITVRCIKDTIAIMLILAVGGLASIGFEQPYVMQNSTVMEVADVVSTFTYRVGLEQSKFSIGTAVGLAQSFINFVLVLSANAISKRVSGSGIW